MHTQGGGVWSPGSTHAIDTVLMTIKNLMLYKK